MTTNRNEFRYLIPTVVFRLVQIVRPHMAVFCAQCDQIVDKCQCDDPVHDWDPEYPELCQQRINAGRAIMAHYKETKAREWIDPDCSGMWFHSIGPVVPVIGYERDIVDTVTARCLYCLDSLADCVCVHGHEQEFDSADEALQMMKWYNRPYAVEWKDVFYPDSRIMTARSQDPAAPFPPSALFDE